MDQVQQPRLTSMQEGRVGRGSFSKGEYVQCDGDTYISSLTTLSYKYSRG
jgi:hypothetical protein